MKYAVIGFIVLFSVSLATVIQLGFTYPLDNGNRICVSRSQLEEWMDDNEYSLLWRGAELNNKWLEVWTDFQNRDNVIVEFDNPPKNNMQAIGPNCILGMSQGTTWNVKAMRKFIDWYENLTKNA